MAINGTVNNDGIAGTANDEVINGLQGDDTLDTSGGGIDTLFGGDGRDLLYTRTGYEVHGDAGNDILWIVGDDPAILDGGADYDIIRFNGGNDISNAVITGVEQLNAYGDGRLTTAQLGAFSLVSGYETNYSTASIVLTAGGTATVTLSATLTNYFQVTGSSQAERLTFNAAYTGTIYAYMGGGNDRVVGGAGNDSMRGESGADSLTGGNGNDSLDGGTGADTMNGGGGNDYFIAGAGDSILGGQGDDLISVTSSGIASISGGANLDRLRFESNYDISTTVIGPDVEVLMLNSTPSMTATQLGQFTTVEGYASNYTSASLSLTQGGTASVNLGSTLSGTFTLYGSAQGDAITFAAGHLGAIRVEMGFGNDNVLTSNGNDTLLGDGGNDTLNGGSGNDSLDGGEGFDLLDGGIGDDYLSLGAYDQGVGGAGNDLLHLADNGVQMLDGGVNYDTLRFASSYDISGATLIGIEQVNLNGTGIMTAAQLDSFQRVQGYADNYTSAVLTLSQGGTAALRLASTLTGGFTLNGSSGVDLVTVDPAHIYAVTMNGNGGNDVLTSAQGNDVLYGGLGDDTLISGVGNDYLDGGAGDDLLQGGIGDDYLVMGAGDSGQGGTGNDMLHVNESGAAELSGGGNYDTLRFAAGYDISSATLIGIEQVNLNGTGIMTAAQLDSFQRVQGYADNYTTAALTLSQGGTATLRLGNTLTGGFTFNGSQDADLITVDAAYLFAVTMYGYAGNDSLTGGQGNDTLYAGSGADTLMGANGNDRLFSDNDFYGDLLDGGNGDDYITAWTLDQVLGGNGHDVVEVFGDLVTAADGGLGQDTLKVNNHDLSATNLIGFEQLNVYSGARFAASQLGLFNRISGFDTGYTSAAITLVAGGTATAVINATLTAGFTLTGSSEADLITFDTAAATRLTVNAGGGNDVIQGSLANDSLVGGLGDDTLNGGNGNDILDGSLGLDSLEGGNGADELLARLGTRANGGNDDDLIRITESGVVSVIGGAGTDTLRFDSNVDLSGATISGVETLAVSTGTLSTAQLALFTTVTGFGPGYTTATVYLTSGGTATINLSSALSAGFYAYGSSEAENLSFNSAYVGPLNISGHGGNDRINAASGNDVLTGNAGNDDLLGQAGNDFLYGGSGRDTLTGGLGVDTLNGGTGIDVFVFAATAHSQPATPDVIADFEAAGANQGDLIDLSAIDADGALGVQDSFVFGSIGLAGVSVVDDGSGVTLVQVNTNNDAAFEMVIRLTDGGTLASSYTAADFIL